jgi:hypothetical protein
VDYFTHCDSSGQHDLWCNGVEHHEDGYLTDLLSRRTVDYVERMAAQDAPFFISLHYTAPHWPWETRDDAERAPTIKDNLFDLAAGNIHVYRRMIHHMDEGIGWIMDALRRTGQLDDTLVVFTSDNGGERFSDNWPLVGGKMDLTEGGIRVPWIAHWPAVIRPGGVSRQLCMTMDWSATMLAAAGVAAHPGYPLDGVSLLPVLRDAAHQFERPLHWRMNHRDQRALRVEVPEGGRQRVPVQHPAGRARARQPGQEGARAAADDARRLAGLERQHAAHPRGRHDQPGLLLQGHAPALKGFTSTHRQRLGARRVAGLRGHRARPHGRRPVGPGVRAPARRWRHHDLGRRGLPAGQRGVGAGGADLLLAGRHAGGAKARLLARHAAGRRLGRWHGRRALRLGGSRRVQPVLLALHSLLALLQAALARLLRTLGVQAQLLVGGPGHHGGAALAGLVGVERAPAGRVHAFVGLGGGGQGQAQRQGDKSGERARQPARGGDGYHRSPDKDSDTRAFLRRTCAM